MIRLTAASLSKKSNTLQLLANAPRVSPDNLQASFTGQEDVDKTAYDLVMEHTKSDTDYDFQWWGQGKANQWNQKMKPRIGYDSRVKNWYHKDPKWVEADSHRAEPEHERRQYVPLTLFDLQRAIDLGRIDVTQPIDLNVLQNSHTVRLATRGPLSRRQYGVMLVEQGADLFKTPGLHIEVQLASDAAIAAVEAAGSTIECSYYDMQSKQALIDTVGYFLQGIPIAKRQLPPVDQDLFQYYNDPKKRGYLCNNAELIKAQQETAEKYGFSFDSSNESFTNAERKHPSQIFYGLKPGQIVNLVDKAIYEPVDQEVQDYNSDKEYYANDDKDSQIKQLYKPRYVEKREKQ